MSFRHKAAAVSQARPRYPTADPLEDESTHENPWASQIEPVVVSPGYLLEWSSCSSRRRTLIDVQDLRAELSSPSISPSSSSSTSLARERLIVLKGDLVDGVEAALRGLGGIDGEFLGRHVDRRGFRGRGKGWWCWEFPEVNDDDAEREGFQRASLWKGQQSLSVLLLTGNDSLESEAREPPRLKQQDAMTNAAAMYHHRYGTVDKVGSPVVVVPSKKRLVQAETVETVIWNSLGVGGVPLEEVLGELVYERWMAFLERLPVFVGGRGRTREDEEGKRRLLEEAMRALDVNMDCSRALERQSRCLESVSHKDWEDVVSRLQRRFFIPVSSSSFYNQQQLRQLQPYSNNRNRPLNEDEEDEEVEEQRSLDRIAYLGGILLPVTVVSGILAIEGDYGPEGNNFWVFWVASVAAAALTILVIHVDRVRSVQVWMEVAADAVLEAGGDASGGVGGGSEGGGGGRVGRKLEDVFGTEAIKMDGEAMRAWKRKRLGWGGAVKKVSGYYRWRGTRGMQFHAP